MNAELYFSLVTRGAGGEKTGEVMVSEPLSVEWDKECRRFNAGGDGDQVGWGRTQIEAAMDYLGKRLGVDRPVTTSFSRRIH